MLDKINPASGNFKSPVVKGIADNSRLAKKSETQSGGSVDKVEISEIAWWLGKYSELPEIRAELVDRVRAEIQSGAYESEEKYEQAIENLLEDLLW